MSLCPQCSYPEVDGVRVRGLYFPGQPCDNCGYVQEFPNAESRTLRELIAEAVRPHLDIAYQQGYICGWEEGDCEEAAMEAARGIMQALKGRLDD